MNTLTKWAFAAAMAGMLSATSALAETKTLRLTVQLPETNHITQHLSRLKEEVEAATDGELMIEIYPAAQLFKDSEVPGAVGSGQIDMGSAVLTRYAGTIPAVDFFYVPFILPTEEAVAKAVAQDGPIRGEIDAAILKTGSRVLMWQPFGNTAIMTNDWDVRDPGSLENKKVRVFSSLLGTAVEVLGGDPVVISGSEQVLAYERGVVDVGMAGITSVKDRKIYEVMNTVTMTNHAVIEFVVIINEAVYQSLSPEHQTILREAAQKVEAEHRAAYALVEAEALEFVRGKMNVVELSPEDVAKWKEAMLPVVDEYISRAGELGSKLIEVAKTF